YSGTDGADDSNGAAWFNPLYRQFLKQSDVPQPVNTWVTVDEHPDSINDGFFIVSSDSSLNASKWGDLPASYHNGACGFSFADGHAEIHKWKSATSIYPGVHYDDSLSFLISFDKLGVVDWQWYRDHTGYTRRR